MSLLLQKFVVHVGAPCDGVCINANRLPALPSASAPLVRWEDVPSLPPSSFSSLITFFANMRTFLLIAVVSFSSAANVKREADAEATAEADASADPAYGRHRGHAG